MNKQVDKNSKGFKHGFLATVEQYGPEVWDSIRRSLAKDLLEEYLHLAALALLDAGASQDKATNLIAKNESIGLQHQPEPVPGLEPDENLVTEVDLTPETEKARSEDLATSVKSLTRMCKNTMVH